jgi:hypothetical protein
MRQFRLAIVIVIAVAIARQWATEQANRSCICRLARRCFTP